MTLSADCWRSEHGMCPKETGCFSVFEQNDICLWSKDLMFKNSRSNLYLIVDKTIVCIITQKLVGKI